MGAATALLSIAMTAGLLTACGRQPAPQSKPELVQTPQDDVNEMLADVQAAKENPSYTDPSKAGAPIHVDPMPKAGGMPGMSGHKMAK